MTLRLILSDLVFYRNSEPERVMVCIHADSDADQNVALNIHFTLMEAFCRENGIRLLKVGHVIPPPPQSLRQRPVCICVCGRGSLAMRSVLISFYVSWVCRGWGVGSVLIFFPTLALEPSVSCEMELYCSWQHALNRVSIAAFCCPVLYLCLRTG